MFYKALEEKQLKVLQKIAREIPIKGSYLAGGTALALQLGHRKSVDLDWFCPSKFNPEQLVARLKEKGEIMESEIGKDTFHGVLDGVRVTWLYYPNPLLKPLIEDKNIPGLFLASIIDIGLMKLIAVSQRGSKKDFIDLFALAKSGIELSYLLKNLSQKFPNTTINYYHIIKSLTYFNDAEDEPMPRMLWENSWEEIKNFFLNKQKSLFQFLKYLN
ncbi:nucleotidyl transferase AbiEii/AbiGii toxin family protein [Carboxydothermus ferrireducens]|uniref:Nucleotidyltransferase component of viral defense system n=1 Tax=Carboxydothermus ferrireducens DSM 11255 TaxID=1119529 RepID=A0ABX2RFD6_9THEO|nr:nucleotidyl transferase AbiEii/AbiGii toxin family protein [Carboxydothermus ferrireducens]NYE58570.1 putative nucleotidyltransferase component of viral defense system [Carboxydothermus ferrireducens DSM 11255]